MKKITAETESLPREFCQLCEEVTALKDYGGNGFDPFATLKFVRMVAKNQEKRVLQLLACNLS
jgi:hypothetical protein